MDRTAVIVLGMHRSGTSLVANLLAHAGFTPPSDLMDAHPDDNPRGYFESRSVAAINNRFLTAIGSSWRDPNGLPAGWRNGDGARALRADARAFVQAHFRGHDRLLLKDPRLCRLWPLWRPCLEEAGTQVRLMHVVRRVGPVIRSLARRDRDPALRPAAITDPLHVALLWLRYNVEAFSHCRTAPCHALAYEDLIADPAAVLQGLARFAGVAGFDEAAGALINPPAAGAHAQPDGLPADLGALTEDAYLRLCGRGGLVELAALANRLETLAAPAPAAAITALPAEPGITAVVAGATLKEVSGSVPHAPGPPVVSAGNAPGARAWLFVSHDASTRGHIYRVKNPVDALNRLGEPACWTTLDHLAPVLSRTGPPRALIVHRCPLDERLAQVIDAMRRAGVPVGYDIDDLVFTPEVVQAGWSRYLGALAGPQRDEWLMRIDGLRAAARRCDFILVPTAPLAAAAAALGPPVFEVANGFSPENLALAELWRRYGRRPGTAFLLGYASGTPTHDADFAQIVPALARVMARRGEVRLCVVGHLHGEVLRGLPPERIEHRPMVPHVNLAYELSRFHLNLIPLERNPFCDAKSPLKFFEAALTGVASVATAGPVYQGLIDPGRNGLLAAQPEQWEEAILTALQPGRAAQLGEAARGSVVQTFSSEALAGRLLQHLAQLRAAGPRPRAGL